MAGIVFRIKVDHSMMQQMQALAPGIDGIIGTIVAGEVENAAKMLVPVRTGFLRSTILPAQIGPSWLIEAGAYYASFIEYGTRKMRAQPFMVPALDEIDWYGVLTTALHYLGL